MNSYISVLFKGFYFVIIITWFDTQIVLDMTSGDSFQASLCALLIYPCALFSFTEHALTV